MRFNWSLRQGATEDREREREFALSHHSFHMATAPWGQLSPSEQWKDSSNNQTIKSNTKPGTADEQL